jgi:TnpA family transposase
VLLPERAWQAGREAFLARRGLPSTAESFIARTVDQIRSGLAALVAAQSAQELEVMPAGYVYMKDDPMWLSERGDAEATRARLYESLGGVQLPELLIAVDSETHFTWELLGRAPSAPEELTPVYAAILVAAMGLDRSEAAVMIPGVRSSAIRRASFLLEEEHALRQANEKVLCALLAQPLAKHWGDGYEASSDLMSLDVSRHVWLARVDPKRRRHAVGTYTHVLNQWGIVYDQPLLLATRDAGAAIEGAIRQSVTRLERLAVDRHGYTDFGMAVAKTLGFDLCPQLYSMRDRHLHVPRGFPVPAELAAIAHADVSLEAIVEGWDEFLRVVASIEQGWRTATEVLERFGSSARGDPAHRAGHALGQLIRTAYLCDYFTLPEFRRSVHQILSRGESVHALQRQICARAPGSPGSTDRGADFHLRGAELGEQLCDGLEYDETAARDGAHDGSAGRADDRGATRDRPGRFPAHQLPRDLPLSGGALCRAIARHSGVACSARGRDQGRRDLGCNSPSAA